MDEKKQSALMTYVKTRLVKDVVETVKVGCFLLGAVVVSTGVIMMVQEAIHPTSTEEKIQLTREYIEEAQVELAKLQGE